MSFSWLQAPPPHAHIRGPTPITSTQALQNIQTYLTEAESQAHLHPDCIFTENGPSFSRHASEGGLVLQLLRRIEKGLSGERITAKLDDLDEDAALPPTDDAKLDAIIGEKYNGLDAEEEAALRSNAIVDKSYNEQMLEQGEEGIEEGEIGARTNLVADEGHMDSKKRKTFDELPEKEKKKLKKAERKQLRKAELRTKGMERESAAQAFKARTGDADGDVEMEEQADLAGDDQVEDLEEMSRPVDTVVQNAPAVDDATVKSMSKDGNAASRKDEKKMRKAQKHAEKKSMAQVRGEIPASAGDEEAEVEVRPEDRENIEVVNRRGQDAAIDGDSKASEAAKESRREKKKKIKANGINDVTEDVSKQEKKKAKKEKKAGL